jgi:riboflavin kinase
MLDRSCYRFADDFYGQRLRVVAVGYLRPEMRFPGGIGELIARIRADVALAKAQLDDPGLQEFKSDKWFQ